MSSYFPYHDMEKPGPPDQLPDEPKLLISNGNKPRAPNDMDAETQGTLERENSVPTVKLALVPQYRSEGNHDFQNRANLIWLFKALPEAINIKFADIVRVAFKVLPDTVIIVKPLY
ncbi:hypothetical protein NDU88_001310 [Pleurodeles waltl]|uniref:Uncharacterized protein n=1 Tax=Pleurodeles waltl TaxID=8319 RepID=A0AAV7U601_PLEWA|nr:hypothetical protein NDU88_001310 [Pleurodeles waltl]